MRQAAPARAAQLARLRDTALWDVVIIGGGATGLGTAVEAAARGYSVVLIEAEDFAKGTSSRATKLVHGGVRYLAQGDVPLVREALRERASLLQNAPHLAQPLAFVVPAYGWWEAASYGAGLKLYAGLAGSRSLGATEFLSRGRTLERLPNACDKGLIGGVRYWDGQFDDARLAVALARTAAMLGAVVLNHCPAEALVREEGRIRGIALRDAGTGEKLKLRARCVVNATGVWVDNIRGMDRDEGAKPAGPIVVPSQGVHLVVDREFLPGDDALLVPRTRDGRVLFAVPWLGKTILGTTDTQRPDVPMEPRPFPQEVDFILAEASRYLARAPTVNDVRSAWAGLRPLVRPGSAQAGATGELSRKHALFVDASGLVTVTGGKWTTYRAMAEDVIVRCIDERLLPARFGRGTQDLHLVGAPPQAAGTLAQAPGDHLYGTDVEMLRSLPGARRWLWRDGEGGLTEAMVRFAVRREMARTVEDVLARRSRLLFLDARQAEAVAPEVAGIVAEELGVSVPATALEPFRSLAAGYRAPQGTGVAGID